MQVEFTYIYVYVIGKQMITQGVRQFRRIRFWSFGLFICGWGLGFWGYGFKILGLGRVLRTNSHGFDYTQWCCEAPTVPNGIGVRPDTNPNALGKCWGNYLYKSIIKL